MDDLIRRQAAIDAIRKCPVKEVTPAYMLIDKAEIMTELMMLPSAWPEIIRCKDCKHYFHHEIGGASFCDRSGISKITGDYVDKVTHGWSDEDFCSHAERRDDRDERSV